MSLLDFVDWLFSIEFCYVVQTLKTLVISFACEEELWWLYEEERHEEEGYQGDDKDEDADVVPILNPSYYWIQHYLS